MLKYGHLRTFENLIINLFKMINAMNTFTFQLQEWSENCHKEQQQLSFDSTHPSPENKCSLIYSPQSHKDNFYS